MRSSAFDTHERSQLEAPCPGGRCGGHLFHVGHLKFGDRRVWVGRVCADGDDLHDVQKMLESISEAAGPRRKKRAQVQGVNTMVKMGLPLVLVSLLQFLSTQPGLTDVQDLHCIEFFAGRGRIAASFRERGHKAAIFERDMDQYSRGQPTRHTLMLLLI